MGTPRLQFQQDEKLCGRHLAVVNSADFEKAVVYALADYATDNPTADEMRGANRVLDRLIRLGEKEEERESAFGPKLVPPELLGKEPESK